MADKRLAAAIEEGFRLAQKLKAARKAADDVEQDLKDHNKKLIATFTKQELKEVKTSLGTARLVPKEVPQSDPDAGGWEATYGYIVGEVIRKFFNDGKGKDSLKASRALTTRVAREGNWEILNKRLGERACKERWDDKKVIPGVKAFHTVVVKYGDAEE